MALEDIVANVRKILKDKPVRVRLTAALGDTTTEDFSVADVAQFRPGTIWEHDDGTGERRYVTDTDPSTLTVTAYRGFEDSTASLHADQSFVILSPRFSYDETVLAIETAIDVDLYTNEVYEIVDHSVSSSATTNAYEMPTAACKKPLSIHQQVLTTDTPKYLKRFSRRYYKTGLPTYSTGAYFTIEENIGAPGTDPYYVMCAHKLTADTLTAEDQRIIEMRALYYLMVWEGPRRVAGPTNQGDRSVQPLDSTRLSQFYKSESERLMKERAADLSDKVYPSQREFVRTGAR